MDKTQKSLIETVNKIVNKENCDCELSLRVHGALELFEQRFNIKLNEEEENQLIDVGLSHMLNNQKAQSINLNEDVSEIMNKYEPAEVFSYIVEFFPLVMAAAEAAGAAGGAAAIEGGAAAAGAAETAGAAAGELGSAEGAASQMSKVPKPNLRKKAMQFIGRPVAVDPDEPRKDNTGDPYSRHAALKQVSQSEGPQGIESQAYVTENKKRNPFNPADKQRRRRMGDESSTERRRRSDEREETANPWGSQAAFAEWSKRLPEWDTEFKGYIQEDAASPIKKKKKIFKIIFIEKGVKKKGTAVSHKGAARIVAGKKFFKVFDEHNKDITSQFAHGKKTDKK